jgi:acetate kinase
MKIMVINCGSSSIKYKLFDMAADTVLAGGLLEQIGEPTSRLKHQTRKTDGAIDTSERREPVADHQVGFKLIGAMLRQTRALEGMHTLDGIGHRVVHGGERFSQPTIIDHKMIATLKQMSPLAPLHNPANLEGIEVARQRAPKVPQVAVFDTAFHQTMPDYAFRYAIPERLYKKHRVRRYGFHGTSHHYVAKQAAEMLARPLAALNLITLHLGNGASAAAIQNGQSIDTSMGMTPLEGLIMGTRCGDIDPAISFYLARQTGMSRDDLEMLLNKESGLKGICGRNDMRHIGELAGSGDQLARLAIAMVVYRLKKYIGAYYAVLGRLDALVFTGGIGENAAFIRKDTCQGLAHLGIELDASLNHQRHETPWAIHKAGRPVQVLVIPTDEEREIATQTAAVIRDRPKG